MIGFAGRCPTRTLRPGAALGLYPYREVGPRDPRTFSARNPAAYVPTRFRTRALGGERFVARVNALGKVLSGMKHRALAEHCLEVRNALRTQGPTAVLAARSFALVREQSERRLGLRHHDCQVLAAWVMLNDMVAEMDTGEGKTIAATLAAATAALAGIPVHVVTVNDYLASRDAGNLEPLFQSLDLSVGVVTSDMEPEARREAYARDVTYCTGRELVFDYLRDRLVLSGNTGDIALRVDRLYGRKGRASRLLLRGLCYAIVDECDSVLIDEARTPMVLSRSRGAAADAESYHQALHLAAELDPGSDFEAAPRNARVILSDRGRERLAAHAAALGPSWTDAARREATVSTALTALHLYQRDRDYLVRDEQVQIIDGNTGRVRPGHTWENGLHQMIEAKEGRPVTAGNEVLARISYQRFFRRYLRLAGMTGTAREVAGELRSVYGLGVAPIPTHHPVRRRKLAERVHANESEMWADVVERVRTVHTSGRPVLIGTRSVDASQRLSDHLAAHGVAHQVLSARQDADEARVVAQAGQGGCITVATNMAGRGTDIRLDEPACALGGLHVIAAQRHEARRIDRQLFGRCARQGDPGSYEVVACVESDLVELYCPGWLARIASWGLKQRPGAGGWGWLARSVTVLTQRLAERHHTILRRDLLAADRRIQDVLGFSGRPE